MRSRGIVSASSWNPRIFASATVLALGLLDSSKKDGERRSVMKYKTPQMQSAGVASSLIQDKTVPPTDHINPTLRPQAMSVLIEA